MVFCSRATSHWIFLYLFVLLLLPGTRGLYFHLGETETKCFIEDVPEDTLVVGIYRVEQYDRIQSKYALTLAGFGMRVHVKNEDESTLMERTYGAEGRFTFTSEQSGQHTICLHSNTTSWFSKSILRVHLQMRVGESSNEYKAEVVNDKISEIQNRIKQLSERTQQIIKEQSYQRLREERFRQTSESTNLRVLVWSFIQTILVLIIGLLQMYHLKRFFEAKKLV